MPEHDRDTYYRNQTPRDLVDFAFDAGVTRVFPDMIRRSVPGYDLLLPMTGVIARDYLRPGTACYDIGCARGATLQAIHAWADTTGVRCIGIDTAPAMIDACAALDLPDTRFLLADATTHDYEPASFVALNYTLQFLDPAARTPLLARLCDSLDGALVLAEKVHRTDATTQARLTGWHEAFKRANGYSDLEIAAKRSALEDVMRTDTPELIERRLIDAGFRSVTRWFHALNFTAWVAETG